MEKLLGEFCGRYRVGENVISEDLEDFEKHIIKGCVAVDFSHSIGTVRCDRCGALWSIEYHHINSRIVSAKRLE